MNATWRSELLRLGQKAVFQLTRRLSPSAAVGGAFRAVLGRDPEWQTAQQVGQVLMRDEAAFEPFLVDLLFSPESARRNSARLLAASAGLGSPLELVSLGSHCYTSQLLKVWGAKQWSGPFDWIFSSLPMVTHCLKDDFETFLDRAQIQPVPLAQRLGPDISRCDHLKYRSQFGVAHVFNHHDAHLDAGYAYFERCVQRLRTCLSAPHAKTFVVTAHERVAVEAQILSLHAALAERTQRFRLVVILVGAPTAPWAVARTVRSDDTLHVWHVNPSSAWQALHFEHLSDDLCLARLLAHSALRDGVGTTFNAIQPDQN